MRTIVSRCLAKESEERYDSTRDLARDLKSIHESTLVPGSVDVSAETRRRWPVGLVVAGCLIVLLALAVGLNVGGLRERLSGEASLEPIESIAVLPLDNISGDPEQEYFADGMTEELIAEISKIGALRVISRQSVMRFKGTDQPLPEIAQALNVAAVVEGSVRRAGDRVRITTQLVQAVPERHIWAESYERELRDVLSLQADVARAIAREIKIELTGQEETLLSGAHPVHPEAYEAYLRGIYHLNRTTPEDYSRSFEYLQRAIEIDPTYAPAYAEGYPAVTFLAMSANLFARGRPCPRQRRRR